MSKIKNAIVVMFDSWQFNYTGCYGNDWIKTPNIDRLAQEGVLFENCYSNGLPTLPVRRSMMTGRYTLQEAGWGPLRYEDTTAAGLCWGTGIDTAIVYNSLPMYPSKSAYARDFCTAIFTHGYDNFHYINDKLLPIYSIEQFTGDPGFMERLLASHDGASIWKFNKHEYEGYLKDKQHWKSEEDQPVVTNIRKAIRVLEERDQNHGLFLWVDSWDPHEPWDPPSVWDPELKCPYDPDYDGADMWLPPMTPVKDIFTEEQMHHIRMLYAEKMTLCDKYFGILCDTVRRLGMWENTLMWLTSDHGEPMGNAEHGHGLMTKCRPWPYEELVHVPLIIKAPGLPSSVRIKSFAQDCDCAPTILEWLGLPVPSNMTGKSLLPICRGEVEKVRDFAIAGYYNSSWSIITEDWSYIHWLKKIGTEDVDFLTAQMAILGGFDTGSLPGSDNPFKASPETTSENDAKKDEPINASMKEYQEQHSLDGEAQWTCTPGAKAEVPEQDELYSRKDQYQLNNVITQHPEKAKELFEQLRLFMAELRAS